MAKSCKTDHKCLARTHMWRCPCCVLEAKLQDNKKLPKWNCCAQRGKFLGFLRVHSSTVALVRNLHTGHISPQYNVVFDDKLQTIFNDEKTEEQQDSIYENLFEDCRECCAREEYDESEILVYEPLPLDKVWLSESKRRNQKTSLQKQRQRNERRQRDLAS